MVLYTDFNGDGKQDLVVGSDVGNPAVLLGDGNGGLGTPTALMLGQGGCGGVAAGDFDGDGKADVVTVGTSGNTKITFFGGAGNGTFAAAVTTDIPSTTDHRYAEAVDLDRDGRLDLVFSSMTSSPGVVHVFRNRGGGRFDPVTALSVSNNPWGLALGDLNGDGKEDLAVVGHLSSKLDILLSAAQ
ncbi:MAG: VCBS repeat-containing protein [Myxococcales bacterium]|nr:VCBS repeat-containing protein [Myxococcales bacterium]